MNLEKRIADLEVKRPSGYYELLVRTGVPRPGDPDGIVRIMVPVNARRNQSGSATR